MSVVIEIRGKSFRRSRNWPWNTNIRIPGPDGSPAGVSDDLGPAEVPPFLLDVREAEELWSVGNRRRQDLVDWLNAVERIVGPSAIVGALRGALDALDDGDNLPLLTWAGP